MELLGGCPRRFKVLKLFKKAEAGQMQSFGDWAQQKNAVAEGLLRDFPWLWAIRNHQSGHHGEFTKVSQDMADLKIELSQSSLETTFLLWAVTSQVCEIFNMSTTCLSRLEGKTWSEAVMQQVSNEERILYLVVVDPVWGESHPTRRITIFRNPEKSPLNEVVEGICQLQGSGVRWLMPQGID